MNRPSLTDMYLMRIACEVRRSYAKHPRSVKPDHFKIQFTRQGDESPETRAKKIEASKARWMANMTGVVVVKNEQGEVLDTYIPPALKRKQAFERQKQQQLERAKQRQSLQNPVQGNDNVNNGTRRTGSENVVGRFPLPKSVRRSKRKD